MMDAFDDVFSKEIANYCTNGLIFGPIISRQPHTAHFAVQVENVVLVPLRDRKGAVQYV